MKKVEGGKEGKKEKKGKKKRGEKENRGDKRNQGKRERKRRERKVIIAFIIPDSASERGRHSVT